MMHAGYPGQFTDTRKKTDCKYHLEGRCSLGDNCPFRHIPELFNSAARAAFAPHSQASICHFYLNGKCMKGDLCAFQHPGSQKEMQIDFDDDESPQQTEQGHSIVKDAVKVPRVQGGLAPQPKFAGGSAAQAMASRRPTQASSLQQPLSNRLGPQPATLRHHSQPPATDQEDTAQGKKSVFERLNGVKAGSALQSRLSKPSSMELDSRPIRRPAKRPINDARELLVETVAAKARVGRKEAELAGRAPSRPARQGGSDLEPTSIAQRRVVAVNRGTPRASPAPVHAPKFTSLTPSESTGHRKSALERIALVQNGTPASSSANIPNPSPHPNTAPRLRRATVEPFVSSRLRPTSTSQTPSQTPSQTSSQTLQASGAASVGVTPAAGAVLAATPSSEVSAGGTDRRGRQKITWQPPTSVQREDAAQPQVVTSFSFVEPRHLVIKSLLLVPATLFLNNAEAKQSISKRKASDAASPALDAALATAAAEETSPSKRMKSASDPANPSQAAPLSQGQFASEGTKQEAVTTAPEASTTEEQEDQPAEAADDALGSALDDGDDDVDLGYDEEGDENGDVLYEDFDDEATMRELEALG